MTKIPPFFWIITSACTLCVSGFISIQNLAAQIDGMLGGWRESFWDMVWTEPGIHLSFMFVAGFGAIFGVTAYAALRRHTLTRNHIIIILIGIVLFIVLADHGVIEYA